MDNIKKKIIKLRNGVRILIIPTDSIITNISVNILLGEKHEKKNEMELTHYMEHLLGRFTSKKYSLNFINNQLNKRGASTNASVDTYETKFYIEGYYKDLDFFADVLANTIKNFELDKSIIKQEKNAVIQELRNYMADSEYIFNMKIWRYMYKKYSYMNDLNKHITHIQSYNTNKIYSYIKNHILLNNIIVIANCPLNRVKKTENILKKHFNFKLKSNKSNKKIIKYPIFQYNNECPKILYIKNKYGKNTTLRIVIDDSIKYNSKEHISLIYLEYILFNFETGIFYKILRDKMGLIYDIGLDLNIDMKNPISSSYYIETTINYKKLPLLIKSIIDIIKMLDLSDSQIESGKKKVLVNYELEKFNDLTSYNTYYGEYLLHKIPIIEKSVLKQKFIEVCNKDIRKTLEKFKNDILQKGLFFYYSKKNINSNIKKFVKLSKVKYISL